MWAQRTLIKVDRPKLMSTSLSVLVADYRNLRNDEHSNTHVHASHGTICTDLGRIRQGAKFGQQESMFSPLSHRQRENTLSVASRHGVRSADDLLI
jgi:hypothetical protein